jgi:uncharacterized repeat protein (TIGR03803 family)
MNREMPTTNLRCDPRGEVRRKSRIFLAVLTFIEILWALGGNAQVALNESVLYSFEPAPTGNHPTSGLIQASDGNFYGAVADTFSDGNGSVYRISASGEYAILHAFGGQPDGGEPLGSLVEGPDGALYGTTTTGGGGIPVGTVFRLTFDGQFTALFDYTGQATGWDTPVALTLGSDGDLYGVNLQGGQYFDGNIFRLSFNSEFGDLYDFAVDVDADDAPFGQLPNAPLLEVSPNFFVGTTAGGGEYGGEDGRGTLFTITSSGEHRVVYNFGNSLDTGIAPSGYMAVAPDGNLYGTTSSGGPNSVGGVFRVSPSGAVTSLHDFNPFPEGGEPGGILLGSDGNLYGANYGGGTGDVGTIFSLSTSGRYTVLYNFPGYDESTSSYPNAALPVASLIQGSDGAFYGTTTEGGVYDAGAVYRVALSPALPPPVELTLSANQVTAGRNVILNWIVHNGFSLGMNQCYAFVQNSASGAGNWSGRQTGSQTSAGYAGSIELTPTASGVFIYALTCGGVESGFATLTVTEGQKNSTSTSLLVSPNPVTQGNVTYLEAAVGGPSGVPTVPTGSVTFASSGRRLGQVSMVNGTATLTASATDIPAGNYLVTATYSGDSNFLPSTSPAQEVTVYAYPAQTSTVLAQITGPFQVNRGVNLYIDVVQTYGGPYPSGGTVTWYFNGSPVSSAPLVSNGFVEGGVSFSGYTPGNYPIYATYSGDANFGPSKSAIQTIVLTTIPTTTTFSISPSTIKVGSSATLQVQVAENLGPGTPTGTVKFTASGVDLGSVSLQNGAAQLSVPTSSYQPGTYTVTATYSGDSINVASSATTSVTLTP